MSLTPFSPIFSAGSLLTSTAGSVSYTENQAPVVINADVTITDEDASNTSLEGAEISIDNFVFGQDLLDIVPPGGVTKNYNPVTGILTLSGTASFTDYQIAFQTATYENASDNPDTTPRIIKMTGFDGDFNSNSLTTTVNIIATNDAPLIAVGSSTVSYTENQSPVPIAPTLSITDPDSENLTGAEVAFTAGFTVGEDALITDYSGVITIMYNEVTGVMTLSGSASKAEYQTVLRGIKFQNSSENPSTSPRTIEISVNDGTATSSVLNLTVNVTPVNNAPQLSGSGGSITYSIGQSPIPVEHTLSVADIDSATLSSATVELTDGFVSTEDLLDVVPPSGMSKNYDSGTGRLTLTGPASVAKFQEALQNVAYQNSEQTPDTSPRTVQIKINDGTSESLPFIKVIAFNRPSVLSNLGATVAYTEGGVAVTLTTTLTVTDADDSSLFGAKITIKNSVVGEDQLNFVTQNGISGNWDPATGTLSLTGEASLQAYRDAVRSVTYQNLSLNPTTLPRTIAFSVYDGKVYSTEETKTLNINSINNSPLVSGSQDTFVYIKGQLNPIAPSLTLSDVDNSFFSSATVKFSSGFEPGDQLVFNDQNGITGSYNAGTGELNLIGSATVAEYQDALQSIAFQNLSQNPSSALRTAQLTVHDGTTESAVFSKNISLNEAPVLSGGGESVNYEEDGPAVPVAPSIVVEDSDTFFLQGAQIAINSTLPGDQLNFLYQNGISGSFNSTAGTLDLIGGASAAHYQTAIRSTSFESSSDNPSTSPRTISVTVFDGGLNSDPIINTLSITPVNDAPRLSSSTTSLIYVENDLPLPIAPDLILDEPDSATVSHAEVAVIGFVPGEDLLACTCGEGSFDNSTGIFSVMGITLPTALQTALRGVTYENLSDNPTTSPRIIEIRASDGSALSDALQITLNITPVNDPPLLSSPDASMTYRENNPPTPIAHSLVITDDSPTFLSAQVAIMSNFVPGEDELGFFNQNGISGLFNGATGILQLTGPASAEDFLKALRSITYYNKSKNPFSSPRTVGFTLNDGVNSNTLIYTITIETINDPPVVQEKIPALNAQVGRPFDFVLPSNTFVDPEGRSLSISAKVVNGDASWLHFNGRDRRFTGTPGIASWRSTTVTMRVTADDGEETSSVDFQINLGISEFLQDFAFWWFGLGLGIYALSVFAQSSRQYQRKYKVHQQLPKSLGKFNDRIEGVDLVIIKAIQKQFDRLVKSMQHNDTAVLDTFEGQVIVPLSNYLNFHPNTTITDIIPFCWPEIKNLVHLIKTGVLTHSNVRNTTAWCQMLQQLLDMIVLSETARYRPQVYDDIEEVWEELDTTISRLVPRDEKSVYLKFILEQCREALVTLQHNEHLLEPATFKSRVKELGISATFPNRGVAILNHHRKHVPRSWYLKLLHIKQLKPSALTDIGVVKEIQRTMATKDWWRKLTNQDWRLLYGGVKILGEIAAETTDEVIRQQVQNGGKAPQELGLNYYASFNEFRVRGDHKGCLKYLLFFARNRASWIRQAATKGLTHSPKKLQEEGVELQVFPEPPPPYYPQEGEEAKV